jgi:putative FmdB family regulatory protein
MPIYEYECESCGRQFEVMQRMTEPLIAMCERCGGHVRKLISQTSFVLKGTGWYVTDYPSESRKRAISKEKDGEGSKTADKPTDKPTDKPAETSTAKAASESTPSSDAKE